MVRADAPAVHAPPARHEAGLRATHRRVGAGPTLVLLVGALYCLFPIAWVLIASTKSTAQLFHSFTLSPSTALLHNIGDLSTYNGGIYWRWMANTAL